jgi:hypothetical protein
MLINHLLEILGDKGYQGINKIHKNSQIPFKKFPKKELTQEQKKSNKQLGKKRVIVENVIGKLKIFKIFSSRSRNRRKRFGLRLNLIAGIYNFELNNKFQLIENS